MSPVGGEEPAGGPDLALESEFWDAGASVVAGLDEVGRGAWAGPLVVGAAALAAGRAAEGVLGEVRDSKALSPKRRSRLAEALGTACDDWAVGSASAVECDALGLSAAQRLAARRALAALRLRPDALLLDGRWDFITPPTEPTRTAHPGHFAGPVRTVVGGDDRCVSLAAASILAKVWRDDLMVRLAARYPHYDFEHNKGYHSLRHRQALTARGASAIHRCSWAPLRRLQAVPPSPPANTDPPPAGLGGSIGVWDSR